jgi:putative tryptophan/tyrosine transport system substrate-binding protein
VNANMKRREFITLLGGAAVAWPFAVNAQHSSRRPMIVYLAAVSSASALRTRRAFLNGLRDHGLVDGQNLEIVYRFADGNFDRLPALAEEAVRLKPDVILAPALATALAAKTATTSIPIVCPLLDNPERQGLAASIARPGGNVTGILRYVDGLAGKHLDLARELVPKITKLGLLVGPDSAAQRRDMEIVASASGIELIAVDVLALDGLEPAIVRLADRGVQALIIPADSLLFGVHRRISAQALDVHLPTIWTYREMVMEGGLASYGVDESESFRRAGYYVHKILNGASPADLPIELPTKFELLINLKTARALGIDVPSQLQLLANEVIE